MRRMIKKSMNRKAEIVQAAQQLFESNCYEKTSMQDVIEQLDIAKGTLYHYFKSKEDLLEAVVEKIALESIDKVQTAAAKAQGGAIQQLRLLIEASDATDGNKKLLEPLHKPGNQGLHIRLLAVLISQLAPIYAKTIQLGCLEGVFKTQAPLECAEFILSGIQFLTDRGIYPWEEKDLKRRINAFPIILEQMLSAKPGTFDFLLERLLRNA